MRIIDLHFDGAITKNPGGVVSCSYILSENDNVIECGHEQMGSGPSFSNNLAEFYGLFFGLNAVHRIFVDDLEEMIRLNVYGDSNVVIRVMNGKYKDKSKKAYFEAYEASYEEDQILKKHGCQLTYQWIPRYKNIIADALSRNAELANEINQNR